MTADNTIISCDDQAVSGITLEKRTYTVQEIINILNISRSKAYDLCSGGNFRTIKIGRSIRVSKASFDKWLDEQI